MESEKCFVVGEASESDVDIVESGIHRLGNLYGTVVPGEAPESDDDDNDGTVESVKNVSKVSNIQEISKEDDVNEDDYDEDSCSSASEAFMYRTSASPISVADADIPVSTSVLKYNTLLHRKLCESNASLHQGVSDLLNRPLVNAVQKLNTVNQHLLSSQVEIQDAVSAMQRSFNTLSKIDNILGAVLSMPYLPKINIAIPPKNNTS